MASGVVTLRRDFCLEFLHKIPVLKIFPPVHFSFHFLPSWLLSPFSIRRENHSLKILLNKVDAFIFLHCTCRLNTLITCILGTNATTTARDIYWTNDPLIFCSADLIFRSHPEHFALNCVSLQWNNKNVCFFCKRQKQWFYTNDFLSVFNLYKTYLVCIGVVMFAMSPLASSLFGSL